MTTIRINPEHVRAVGKQFNDAGSQSQDIVNRLQQAVGNLQSEWQGLSQQAFYAEYQQWQTTMGQFVQLLGKIGQELTVIANDFEERDRLHTRR